MKNIVLLCLFIILSGCSNNTTKHSNESDNLQFNNQDVSVETNGNTDIAIEKLNIHSSNNSFPVAEKISISELTRSPYSNIGKFVLVEGQVYKVEELPPRPNVANKMAEVLLLAKNNNSALGSTTIDCICFGDTSHVQSNSVASCGGYFIGTYTTQNALGGEVEALVFMGNVAHSK